MQQKYDLGEDSVAFEVGTSGSGQPLESSLDAEQLQAIVQEDVEQTLVQETEHQRLINQAISEYDVEFFKQFSFDGKIGLKMAQQGLEDYIMTQIHTEEQLNMLLLSMINQAYTLNEHIPNIELLLFKMFMSPIRTRELRKEDDTLLAGNIFFKKGFNLHEDVYKSLLETLTMRPKKKYFKKISEYIRKREDVKTMKPQLLD